MSDQSKWLPILAFAVLGVIWGSNFIFMKNATLFITPVQVAFFRFLFGFLPIVVFAIFTNSLRLKHLRHAHHYAVMAALVASLYYGYAKGSALLLSGLAGALSGSIPIFTFILAMLFIREERATFLRMAGVFAGFAGVVVIADPTSHGLVSPNIEGVLCMVGGSVGFGASFVYAKKFIAPLNIPSAASTTYQLSFALILMGVFTDFSGFANIFESVGATLGLVLGLGLFGSGAAYLIYYYIINKMGAVTASAVTYIPPVVALAIGCFIVAEPISLMDYFATLLIFAGVYLVRRG